MKLNPSFVGVLASVLLLTQTGRVGAQGQRPAPTAAEARVLSVEGTFQVNGKPAAAGALLRKKDRLTTGANSRAFIGFPDGSVIRLNANSKLDLSEVGPRTRLQLKAGSALNAVGRGADYSVVTPRAVAAVRGTVFFVQAHPEGPGYVCVCEGKLELRIRTCTFSARLRVNTEGHHPMTIKRDEIVPDMVSNHSDQEIAQLKEHVR